MDLNGASSVADGNNTYRGMNLLTTRNLLTKTYLPQHNDHLNTMLRTLKDTCYPMNILEGIPATKADIVSILDSDIKTRTEFAQTFYNNFSRCVGLPVLTLTVILLDGCLHGRGVGSSCVLRFPHLLHLVHHHSDGLSFFMICVNRRPRVLLKHTLNDSDKERGWYKV